MKKLITLILALSIVFVCAVANASPITNTSDATGDEFGIQTRSTTVDVELNLGKRAEPSTYTVEIPSKITLDPDTGKKTATVTLKAGYSFTDIQAFSVYVAGLEAGSYITLTNTDGSEEVKCYVKQNNENIEGAILTLMGDSGNSQDQVATLEFSVDDLPRFGDYSGQVTFEVKTKSIYAE